jgi:hypothetical protein
MRIKTHVDRVVVLIFIFFSIAIVGVGFPLDASSQPEKIRPGHSYYSDELGESTNQGLVRAPGEEKNYEEVYQFYSYYEFVYDEQERVVLFREYKRGDVIRTEKYSYDDSGALSKRVVSQPGRQDEITLVEASESKLPPKQRSD